MSNSPSHVSPRLSLNNSASLSDKSREGSTASSPSPSLSSEREIANQELYTGSPTCVICLEKFSEDNAENEEQIAKLPTCGHLYHNVCIKQWTERTNSCPTCRSKFNTVELLAYYNGPLTSTYDVKDRTAPIPDEPLDPSILAEYEAELWDSGGRSIVDILYDNCVICGSGEAEHELLICDGCDRTFHVSCLGLGEIPFGDWYCPSCEVENTYSSFNGYGQEQDNEEEDIVYPHRSRNRSSVVSSSVSAPRRRRITRSVQRSSLTSLLENSTTSSHQPTSRRRVRRRVNPPTTQRSSSLLFGSDFISVRDVFEVREEVRRVRRQARNRVSQSQTAAAQTSNSDPEQSAAPQMSQTEREAWEMFDQARSLTGESDEAKSEMSKTNKPTSESLNTGSTSNAANSSTSLTSSQNKKLKRPSRRHNNLQHAAATPVQGLPAESEDSPTLVQSLLSNIRNNSSSSPSSTAAPIMPILPPSLRLRPNSPNSPFEDNWLNSNSTEPLSISSPEMSEPASISSSPSPGPFISLVETPSVDTQLLPVTKASHRDQKQPLVPPLNSPPSKPQYSTDSAGPLLSLSRKEEIQQIVRNSLRPLYRSGKINKDQYTVVNKSVSRALYKMVLDDDDMGVGSVNLPPSQISKLTQLARDLVSHETG